MTEKARRPSFAATALERDIASWLSLPLAAHEDALGALNLYAR
jgi:hypothetical protein